MNFLKNIKDRKKTINELSLISQEKYYQNIELSDDVEEQYDMEQLQVGMAMRDKKTKKKLIFLSICENNDIVLVDEEANAIVWYNKKDIEPA